MCEDFPELSCLSADKCSATKNKNKPLRTTNSSSNQAAAGSEPNVGVPRGNGPTIALTNTALPHAQDMEGTGDAGIQRSKHVLQRWCSCNQHGHIHRVSMALGYISYIRCSMSIAPTFGLKSRVANGAADILAL